MRHRLDHFGAGHEHVGTVLDHENEIGHRRAVDRPPGARAHDHADLRDHTRRQYVFLKHVSISAQGRDAFLNSCPPRVIQPDHWRPCLHGLIHHLADLLGMGFG